MNIKDTNRLPLIISGCYAAFTAVSFFCILRLLKPLSGPLAVHWNLRGQGDFFLSKTVFVIVWAGWVVFLYGIICIFSHRSGSRLLRNFSPQREMEKSALVGYLKLKNILTGFILLWVLIAFDSVAFFSIWYSHSLDPAFVMPFTLSIVLSTFLLLFVVSKILHRWRADLLRWMDASSRQEHPELDGRYWKWGILYKNPADPRFFIPRRSGLGWTVNMAYPGWVWLLLFLIVCVAFIFGFV